MSSSYIDWPRYSRLTWMVAALLTLLLLVLWLTGKGPGSAASCCGRSEVVAAVKQPIAPPAELSIAPPVAPSLAYKHVENEFKLLHQGDKVELAGVVADQDTHDRILQSAAAAYGAANVDDQLTVDPAVSVLPCVAKQKALFDWLKSGIESGIACNNDSVVLTGVVARKAESAKREKSAHDILGADVTLINQLAIKPVEVVEQVAEVRCGGSIAASITFANGGARIGDVNNKNLLDAIALCLFDGKYEIGGHTDSTGSDGTNLALSQRRADAIRGYLIRKGIGPQNLTAVGYGAQRSIATNATEEGRARNRRVEFVKK